MRVDTPETCRDVIDGFDVSLRLHPSAGRLLAIQPPEDTEEGGAMDQGVEEAAAEKTLVEEELPSFGRKEGTPGPPDDFPPSPELYAGH